MLFLLGALPLPFGLFLREAILEVAQLLQPLVVAGLVLKFGQTGWRRGRPAPSRFHLGQKLGAKRFERRRLARHETQERADVVHQFQTHGLLLPVQLQHWSLKHRRVQRAVRRIVDRRRLNASAHDDDAAAAAAARFHR